MTRSLFFILRKSLSSLRQPTAWVFRCCRLKASNHLASFIVATFLLKNRILACGWPDGPSVVAANKIDHIFRCASRWFLVKSWYFARQLQVVGQLGRQKAARIFASFEVYYRGVASVSLGRFPACEFGWVIDPSFLVFWYCNGVALWKIFLYFLKVTTQSLIPKNQ